MNKTQRLNEIENSQKGAGQAFFQTLVDMYVKLEYTYEANFEYLVCKISNKVSLQMIVEIVEMSCLLPNQDVQKTSENQLFS